MPEKSLLTEFLVSGCVHEFIEVGLVGEFHLNNPVFISILVHQLWLILQCLIDFDNSATNG